MIKIVFNPFYGSHIYLNLKDRGTVIGEKHMGSSALVGELRLRVGLPSILPDVMERTALYMRAISTALQESKGPYVEIFRHSFAKDELGVATTLLGWRDALVGLGWSPNEYTESQKLNALMDIERFFHSPGVADFRRELLLTLESGQASLSDVSIESILPADMLPCYFSRLLAAAERSGAAVSYSAKPVPSAPEGTSLRALQEYLLLGKQTNLSVRKDDPSLRVYHFSTADDAMKYAALSAPNLISANDTVLLREVFRVMNLPLPMVEGGYVPQVVRLLPLALSFQSQRVDVNSLLAFLSIEPNPLSSLKVKRSVGEQEWYVSANRVLREILLGERGLNEQWYSILNGDIYDREGVIVKSEKRKRLLKLISTIGTSDGVMNKAMLEVLLDELMGWATKDLESRGALLQYCRFAKFLVDGMGEEFDVESLIRWLSSATPMQNYIMPAEVGSCEVTNTPSSVVDEVATMCWADCWTTAGGLSALEFLSPVDIEELGIEVDTPQKLYDAQRYSFSYGISKVKESLTILTCDKEGGELVQPHPFLVELKSCCGLNDELGSMEAFTSKFQSDGIPVREIEHRVNGSCFKEVYKPKKQGGIGRNHESYSSLNTLINFPFDYVMRYLLHWDAYGVESMADVETIKGNIAHRYIEELFNDSGKDISKAKDIHTREYFDRVERCMLRSGAIMYLDEHSLEAHSYRVQLNNAVHSLLLFIETNKLRVIGLEYAVDTELPVIGPFVGRVDLLLADANNQYIVVDMKWSEGGTYKRRLENGDNLQLVLYKKALETQGKRVVCEGYFVLPQRKFFTSSNHLPPSDIVEIITNDSVADHFKLACNSYQYRLEQISRGVIEEGEGAQLSDIQYHRDMLQMRLYPLCRDYNEDTLKGTAYGNPNSILKGGIE